jgi:coenzyme F420-reducing hydrogenase delta subunit
MAAKNTSIRIIAFCCQHALSAEKKLAEDSWMSFEPTIKIVQLPCSSKVDTLPIIKAFEAGADGIIILGCLDANCHLLDGNLRAKKVVDYTKRLLEDIGIESDRLEMFQLETAEWKNFGQIAKSMTKRITALGKTM